MSRYRAESQFSTYHLGALDIALAHDISMWRGSGVPFSISHLICRCIRLTHSRVFDEDLDGREPLLERLREVIAVTDAADGHLDVRRVRHRSFVS